MAVNSIFKILICNNQNRVKLDHWFRTHQRLWPSCQWRNSYWWGLWYVNIPVSLWRQCVSAVLLSSFQDAQHKRKEVITQGWLECYLRSKVKYWGTESIYLSLFSHEEKNTLHSTLVRGKAGIKSKIPLKTLLLYKAVFIYSHYLKHLTLDIIRSHK